MVKHCFRLLTLFWRLMPDDEITIGTKGNQDSLTAISRHVPNKYTHIWMHTFHFMIDRLCVANPGPIDNRTMHRLIMCNQLRTARLQNECSTHIVQPMQPIWDISVQMFDRLCATNPEPLAYRASVWQNVSNHFLASRLEGYYSTDCVQPGTSRLLGDDSTHCVQPT